MSLPSHQDWNRLGPVVLVGHRGAGKSTLGRRVADRLDRPFFDLDDEIESATGTATTDLVERDLQQFRRHERRRLKRLLDDSPTPIIACGAGLEPIPEDCLTVWIDRADWREEVADSDRPRIRPELDEVAEWEWMERTREPRWIEAADLRLPVPRGRSVDDSAQQLSTLLKWAAAARDNPVASRTWMVPTEPEDFERARRDARRLGLAGVEVRSDVFATPPPIEDPDSVLASLRHGDPGWLETIGEVSRWDIEAGDVAAVCGAELQDRPDRLVVSAHTSEIRRSAPARLEEAARRASEALGIPPENVVLKYVAAPEDFGQLSRLLEVADQLRASRFETTILTGNRRFGWLRPVLAADNATNYLPVGLRRRNSDHPAPLDLMDLLPHLAGPVPRRFDGLVGDPVDHSRGDLWHRRAALECDEPETGYLKIPVGRGELDEALPVLQQLPIRGLSVTSPLKTEAADSERVDNSEDLPALNTLVRTEEQRRPWRGTDTDTEGMERTLEKLETRSVAPGRALVIGRGGASHAVVRAIKRRDWQLVDHLSARAGWQPEHAGYAPLELIVNAGGPDCRRNEHTPETAAWVDLHYVDVAPAPPGAVHLQGDLFFVAQARAQRRFWMEW